MNSQAYQSRQSAYSAAAGNLGLTVVVLGGTLPLVDADLTLRPALFGLQAFTAIERNAAYDRVQSASQNLRLSTALFAAIYVMSLVDVVVFQPSPTSAVAVYAGHSGVGMQFQMRW
jgi:hypothetical protein